MTAGGRRLLSSQAAPAPRPGAPCLHSGPSECPGLVDPPELRILATRASGARAGEEGRLAAQHTDAGLEGSSPGSGRWGRQPAGLSLHGSVCALGPQLYTESRSRGNM